jgi:hypothetical protein
VVDDAAKRELAVVRDELIAQAPKGAEPDPFLVKMQQEAAHNGDQPPEPAVSSESEG